MCIWADLVMALSNLISLKTAVTQKKNYTTIQQKIWWDTQKKNLRQKKNNSIMCYYP